MVLNANETELHVKLAQDYWKLDCNDVSVAAYINRDAIARPKYLVDKAARAKGKSKATNKKKRKKAG